MVTFRVESTSRWDALALAGKLTRYHWYLIEPDDCHWDVCIPVEQPSRELPDELRRTIKTWLGERRLAKTIVHADAEDYVVGRSRASGDEHDSADPRPFFAERRSLDDGVVVRIGGECDAATLGRLSEALEAAVDERPRHLVVDLSEATFVDSLTLGSLTAAAKRVRGDGGSFRVCGVAAEVRRAFELTGLDTYLL
jgi:anti-anti-sigma factor